MYILHKYDITQKYGTLAIDVISVMRKHLSKNEKRLFKKKTKNVFNLYITDRSFVLPNAPRYVLCFIKILFAETK